MSNPYKKKFRAKLDTFTNRESFKEILKNSVEESQRYDEYRIKVFYGVGGQGKSYLKNDFFVNEYLLHKGNLDPNIVYCDNIDFENKPSTREPDIALLSIAEQLIEKGKIALPAFCFGFLKYLSLTSLSKNFQDQYPYLYKITGKRFVGNKILNNILNEITHFGLNTLLGEVAGNIPFIGNLVKNETVTGKNKLIEWIQSSDAKEILKDIDTLDKLALLNRLPVLLGYDVYKALEYDCEGENQSRRIVLIIDGYETLWAGEKNNNINKDEWIRSLVKSMPGVLFVIFGRDELRWNKIEKDEEFINSIEQHLIKGFSDNDANQFLNSVPIEDAEIRKAIIINAKAGQETDGCLPFYLQIEAKTFENIMNSNNKPTKEAFIQGNEKTEKEIIDRFFKHLDSQTRNAIKALSLSVYIDDDIIEVIEKAGGIAANIIDLKTLNEYSFVNMQGSRATMHSLVQGVASEEFKNTNFRKYIKIHEALFDYFNNKISHKEYQEITTEKEMLLEYAGFHKEKYDVNGFANWIVEKSSIFYGNSYYNTLNKLLKKAVDIFFLNKRQNIKYFELIDAEKETLGKLYYHIAKQYYDSSNPIDADNFISSAITYYEQILTAERLQELKIKKVQNNIFDEEINTVAYYKTALELAAKIKSSKGRNIESGRYYDKAKEIAVEFNLNFDNYEYSRHLRNIGRLAEAEPVFFIKYTENRNTENKISVIKTEDDLISFFNIKEEKSKAQFEDLKKDALRLKKDAIDWSACAAFDLAKLFCLQGRFEEAIYFHQKCLKQLQKIKESTDINIGIGYHILATTLLQEGKNFDKAEHLLNQTWEIYKTYYNEKHLNVGYFYRDLFDLTLTKEIEKALEYYYKAKEIISNNVGEINASYITMLIDIAEKLKMTPISITDEFTPIIINYFLNDFENVKELLGIYNNALHRGISITADYLETQGKKELAESLRKKKREFIRVLQVRTHIRTASLTTEIITSPIKENILSQFKKITSLPDEVSSIEFERIILPFYKTYNLFQISFLNSEKIVYKYILYDNLTPIAIDWNARNILDVNDADINLTATSVVPYIIFFCDSISGQEGKFYLLLDSKDIPWRQDIDIDEKLKFAIEQKIKPLIIKSENENSFIIEGYMVFQDFIFKCEIEVKKTTGAASMLYDERVHVYKCNDTFICNLVSEEDKLIKNENCIELDSMPCCIDPLY